MEVGVTTWMGHGEECWRVLLEAGRCQAKLSEHMPLSDTRLPGLMDLSGNLSSHPDWLCHLVRVLGEKPYELSAPSKMCGSGMLGCRST